MRVTPGVTAKVSCGLLLVLAACDRPTTMESSSAAAVTLSDSAGIQVLDVPAAVLNALPTRELEAEPSVVIGKLDGLDEEMFGSVTDATLLSDGSIVIVDRQQSQLLVFDGRGAFRHRIGGEGDGPGEFRFLRSVSTTDDTLYAHSSGLVSRFLADGTFLDSKQASVSVGLQMGLESLKPVTWRVPTLYWKTRNDYPGDVPEGNGPHDILFHIAVADTSGGTLFATLDAAPGYWVRLTAAQLSLARDDGLEHFPVGNVMHHPLAADIDATYVNEGPVVGRPDAATLEFRDHSWQVRRIARYELESDLEPEDGAVLEWLVSLGPPTDGPIVRRAWERLPRPDAPGTFFDLRAGRQNDVWIATRPVPGDRPVPWTRWLRVGSDGTPIEWVLTPSLDILEVGTDGVLALTTDDLGVHRVARYAFQ